MGLPAQADPWGHKVPWDPGDTLGERVLQAQLADPETLVDLDHQEFLGQSGSGGPSGQWECRGHEDRKGMLATLDHRERRVCRESEFRVQLVRQERRAGFPPRSTVHT